jgi:hypothetical protein
MTPDERRRSTLPAPTAPKPNEVASGRIGLIEEAIRLTKRAGDATVDEANQLLERRSALIARAGSLPTDDPALAKLKARQLQAADRALVEHLWRRHSETFAWLAERAPSVLDAMPRLVTLAHASGSAK